jgi:hypothetical protein
MCETREADDATRQAVDSVARGSKEQARRVTSEFER